MVYRIATMGEPKTLDPHGVSGTWENYVVGDAFMGLLTDAADANADPGCGRELDDQRRRPDLHVQDPRPYMVGRRARSPPTTSSTRFQRILDPKLAAEYASLLYPIKNAEAFNTGTITDPSQLGVKALDPKTLEITLEGPTGYFLELLTHYTAWPVPKHAIDKYGADWVKPGNFVGNGAVHDRRVDAATPRSWR